MTGVRRACYGIAEIADSLGVGRQLVAAWRRRGSHGLPEPDAELASGPVWLGSTIEPWMDQLPVRPTGPDPVSVAEIHRAARRVLRLLALLLEDPPRTALVAQAMAEVREVAEGDDGDPVRAGLLRLLAPVTDDAEPQELRRRLLVALPALSELVLSLDGGGRVCTAGAG